MRAAIFIGPVMATWTQEQLDRIGRSEELALAAGNGTIRAGGIERNVIFGDADPDLRDAIDAAYHAKYDRYGPTIVGTVVGPDAHDVTIRLVPADAKEDM
jgi:hypothetical protein